MAAPIAIPPARRMNWLRDERVRRALLEAVTIGIVAALTIYIAARAQAAGGLDLAFMQDRAGFGVGDQVLTDVSGRDSRWMAYLAGLMNTLRITVFGIALSMVVGFGVGIARLSSNWLAAKLAFGYVEFVRNMPLPVFVVFCYTAVVLRLPRIQESADILGLA
ncbi:MAG: ABC transporter permease subunit, partial [Dehalococcoidia bacterium]|nr:ABC transporter permease subunit [Dehalococcoidia bacterium]